jgi:hypothetical protein
VKDTSKGHFFFYLHTKQHSNLSKGEFARGALSRIQQRANARKIVGKTAKYHAILITAQRAIDIGGDAVKHIVVGNGTV